MGNFWDESRVNGLDVLPGAGSGNHTAGWPGLLWPESNAASVIGALSTFPQIAQSAF